MKELDWVHVRWVLLHHGRNEETKKVMRGRAVHALVDSEIKVSMQHDNAREKIRRGQETRNQETMLPYP